MFWNCPKCAFENQSTNNVCAACGFVRTATKLIISSKKTGKSHSFELKNDPAKFIIIGSVILKILGDEDVKYIHLTQMKLELVPEKGLKITSLPEAKNPTYLNNQPISELGEFLKNDDQLSIKGRFFFLDVKLS